MKVISTVLGTLILVLGVIFSHFNDDIKKKERELQAAYASLSEIESKIADISRESQDEIARVAATYDQMVKEMKDEMDQGEIKIRHLSDRLSVTMVDRILFPSGGSKITPEGMLILTRIGEILKNVQGKIIRIEGHTDNVRITPRLQKKFPTNWELSTTRATNVVRFLQDQVGIEGARLRAVGMSEYQPVASNATSEGRSQNRRIEIYLLPEPKSKLI